MKKTASLRALKVGEQEQRRFPSAQALHSFSSTISYVNRVYLKPTGKVLRAKYDYDKFICSVSCETFHKP